MALCIQSIEATLWDRTMVLTVNAPPKDPTAPLFYTALIELTDGRWSWNAPDTLDEDDLNDSLMVFLRETGLGSVGKAYEHLLKRPGSSIKRETRPSLWDHIMGED